MNLHPHESRVLDDPQEMISKSFSHNQLTCSLSNNRFSIWKLHFRVSIPNLNQSEIKFIVGNIRSRSTEIRIPLGMVHTSML